jgi:hypothetical protein
MEAQELKALIKQSVREVLQEEWFKFYEMLTPYVSDEEQQEIEQDSVRPLTITRMISLIG